MEFSCKMMLSGKNIVMYNQIAKDVQFHNNGTADFVIGDKQYVNIDVCRTFQVDGEEFMMVATTDRYIYTLWIRSYLWDAQHPAMEQLA